MSRESLVIILGVVVFFTTSVSIPADWKFYILSGSGVILIIVGFFLRRAAYIRRIDRGNGERGTDSFTESRPLTAVDEPEEV